MVIKLDGENEDWLRTVRLQRLEKRGWKGTLAEWVAASEILEADPLDHEPPITTLADAKGLK